VSELFAAGPNVGAWVTPYSEAMEAERCRVERQTRALFVAGMWVQHKHERDPKSLAESRKKLIEAKQNRLAKAVRYVLSLRWVG
jgi:hypothetical protein